VLALPPSILEPLWDQFAALLPHRDDAHPLGCHRARLPEWVIFDKLIRAWSSAAATAASPTTPVQQPPCVAAATSGSPLGVAEQLRLLVLGA
jgi:hypothetical protein